MKLSYVKHVHAGQCRWCNNAKAKPRKVQSKMQQILFSAENTIQGVFWAFFPQPPLKSNNISWIKMSKYTENSYTKTYKYGFHMPSHQKHNRSIWKSWYSAGIHVYYRNTTITKASNIKVKKKKKDWWVVGWGPEELLDWQMHPWKNSGHWLVTLWRLSSQHEHVISHYNPTLQAFRCFD